MDAEILWERKYTVHLADDAAERRPVPLPRLVETLV